MLLAVLEHVTIADLVAIVTGIVGLCGGTYGIRAVIKYIRTFITIAEQFTETAKDTKQLVESVKVHGEKLTELKEISKEAALGIGSVNAAVKALLEIQEGGILLADGDGKVVHCNGNLCRMTGRQREDMLGDAWKDFLADTCRPIIDRAWSEIVAGHRSVYITEVDTVDVSGDPAKTYRIRIYRKRDDKTAQCKILVSFSPMSEST